MALQKPRWASRWVISNSRLPRPWHGEISALSLFGTETCCHTLYIDAVYLIQWPFCIYVAQGYGVWLHIVVSSGGDIKTTSTSPSAPWATHCNIWNVQRPFWGALLQDLQQIWWKQSKSKVCSLKSEGFTLGSSLSNFFFSLTSEVNQSYHRMSKRNDNPNGSYSIIGCT